MILHLGDSLEVLKQFADNSIDACVTDPPYGLKFMNKHWDYDVPKVELWREVLRVLKPGAHLLSFGGTRTYHRMVVAIEDAGFEVRDQIQWIYGSGFPKSLDVSKAIDKAAGAEREVIGAARSGASSRAYQSEDHTTSGVHAITAPATDLAKQWDGWGTALKPANEPIVLARKPLEKGLTVAENVLKWGCGALNVDGCRIEASKDYGRSAANSKGTVNAHQGFEGKSFKIKERSADYASPLGRWPANVLFDEEAAEILGEPSRFFYIAKASKRERNSGLEGMPEKELRSAGGTTSSGKPTMEGRDRFGSMQSNNHPTVKPIKLMEYLCKLITPPNGIVLDPFMGSGSTGVAAKTLGYEFIGIEMNADYLEIATKRIENASQVNE